MTLWLLLPLFATLRVQTQGEAGLVLHFALDTLDTVTLQLPDGPYLRVEGPWTHEAPPGYPQVPDHVVEFALPPGAVPEVEVRVLKRDFLSGIPPLLPLPHWKEDGLVKEYRPDPEVYRRDALYPETLYRVTAVGIFRHQRYATLKLHPIRYNPAGRFLEVVREMEVRIRFRRAAPPEPLLHPQAPDPFEHLYRRRFVNYADGKRWRVRAAKTTGQPQDPFARGTLWVKVLTTRTGWMAVTGQDLMEAGIPSGLATDRVKLFGFGGDTLPSRGGAADTVMPELPLEVHDHGNPGELDPEDTLFFFAVGMQRFRPAGRFLFFRHPYADTNVYWIAFGADGPPMPFPERDVSPLPDAPERTWLWGLLHHERDMINLAEKGLLWVGELLERSPGQSDVRYTFTDTLSDVIAPDGVLHLALVGASGPVRVQANLNGQLIWDQVIGTIRVVRFEPVEALQDGENRVEFVLRPANQDTLGRVYLDYYELRYKRRLTYRGGVEEYYEDTPDSGLYTLRFSGSLPPYFLDVTDPTRPVRLVGAELLSNGFRFTDTLVARHYFLSDRIIRPDRIALMQSRNIREGPGADYLLIVPRALESAVQPLVRWRSRHLLLPTESGFQEGEGRVAVVRLEDIFERFGWGIPDPVALRNFLAYAYTHWPPTAPTYVVLVGDGTYDYKNLWSSGGNLLPPYYRPKLIVNINDAGGPLEDFFADVDGVDNGDDPDFFIGRIPVRTSTELRAYIEKIRRFETGVANGPWRNTVFLVGDDEYQGANDRLRCETEHTYYLDLLHRNHIPPHMRVKLLYMAALPDVNRGAEAKRRFVEGFNTGTAFISIFMHGNPKVLAHEHMFLAPDDYPLIQAGARNPLVTALSCKIGAFDRITPPRVIGENWTIGEGTGVAVIASSSLSYHSSNYTYTANMMDLAFDGQLHPLGEIHLTGKNISSSMWYYLLLGDPAIAYGVPPRTLTLSLPSDTLHYMEEASLTGQTTSGASRVSLEVFPLRSLETLQVCERSTPRTLTILWVRDPFFRGSALTDGQGNFLQRFFVTPGVDTGGPAYVLAYDPKAEPYGAVGLLDSLVILPSDRLPLDTLAPRIRLYYDEELVPETLRLYTPEASFTVEIEDEHGIRTVGDPPLLVVNNRPDLTYLLGDRFEYLPGSATKGEAVISLTFPSDTNRVEVRATDNLGLQGFGRWTVIVQEKERFAVRNLLAYPNPYRGLGEVYFTFEITQRARVRVRVYTVAGSLVWRSEERVVGPGFVRISWNGRDAGGDLPANGLYYFVVEAFSEEVPGEVAQAREKLILAR